MTVVPMDKGGVAIGTIAVVRDAAGPLSNKQVALRHTFADQAVIAIENVRLFKELQARNAEVTESLEQQTATTEILKIIASSPSDVQPVFDAIVKSGVRLFGGMIMSLRLIRGNHMVSVASSTPFADDAGGEFPIPLANTRAPTSRAVAHRESVQILDVLAKHESISDLSKKRAELRGWRASLHAPMLGEGRGDWHGQCNACKSRTVLG
jgi:hypothetical protein